MQFHLLTGVFPDIVEHPIVPFKQRFDWDGGFACIAMVLDHQKRQKFIAYFRRICAEGDFGEGPSSLDLCYILKDFNVPHKYLTMTFAGNPEHRFNGCYESLKRDVARLNFKLQHAKQKGIDVKKCSVNNQFLIDHLDMHGTIILLTSELMLFCDLCTPKKRHSESCACQIQPPMYLGCHIVLCGYNGLTQKFMYRNPLHDNHVCNIPYQELDKARKAKGTYEDVILLYNKTPQHKVFRNKDLTTSLAGLRTN
ncbi:protein GUCD1-like [Anopheles cruzii]|uniref:protein GUCD1-like n=1 Tax=Anopheles cruzii TaxID=68878 RepID=UPI0022EC1DB1|nr:protein GUCD1-like [Anopheles cruzii]